MTEAINLASIIRSYLKLKRALGRGYALEERVLQSLNKFLLATKSGVLTNTQFELWCKTFSHLTPTVRRNRMRVVRNFCLYRSRTQPGCFIPDKHFFPAPHQPIQPYIYTEAQIAGLLKVADRLPARPWFPLRPQVYRLAIVLLYTAGLRRGELVRLAISDYSRRERTLHIRESKFHKSRYVPLSSDACRELELYLAKRRKLRLPMQPDSPLLWNAYFGGRPYTGAGLGQGIHELLLVTNIRRKDGSVPRVHDFRFTFAVHALVRWYRAGIDVQNKLPMLAAYMGHVSIVSTEYYLPFVPELKIEASNKFCKHYGALVQPLSEEKL
jgi:integrase/recombinase XerD